MPIGMFSPEKKAYKELYHESQNNLKMAIERIESLEAALKRLQNQSQATANDSTAMDQSQPHGVQDHEGQHAKSSLTKGAPTQGDQTEPMDYAGAAKKQRIPPIFVNKFKDINTLVSILTRPDGAIPTFQALSNGEAKIMCSTEDMYRFVRNTLAQIQNNPGHSLQQLEFYTYQLKSEKLFQIVIRGLYPTTPVTEIQADLANAGHELISAANIIGRRTVKKKTVKKPLPLFFVNLKPKANNNDVFELTYLLHTKISVEAPRKKKEIPQCKKCQAFNHTQAYCSRHDKCVKCAGAHPTSTCTKKKTDPCKCANCHGEHTANWKGCPKYQEKVTALSKRKVTVTQRIQHRQETIPVSQPCENSTSQPKQRGKKQTASVTQSSTAQTNLDKPAKEPTVTDIWNFLQKMDSRIDKRISKMDSRISRLENKYNQAQNTQPKQLNDKSRP